MINKTIYLTCIILVFISVITLILASYRGDIHEGTLSHILGSYTRKESRFKVDELQNFFGDFNTYLLNGLSSLQKDLEHIPASGAMISTQRLTPRFYEFIGQQKQLTNSEKALKSWYPHITSGIDPWGNPIFIDIEYIEGSEIYFKDNTSQPVSSVEEVRSKSLENILHVSLNYKITIRSAGMNRRDELGHGDDMVRVWNRVIYLAK